MLESEMEKLLIEQLCCDVSQWTYRDDIRTEADLWDNLRQKLNQNNIALLDGVPLTDEEMSWIENVAKRLKSNFVTIDIARRTDGRLIIMELGDGQVSGLQQIHPQYFYRFFA